MNEVINRRRGFCPSAWTPMESGDGFIVRVSPGLPQQALFEGRAPVSFWGLSAEQLRGIAEVARLYGRGLVELTRRANAQLRGVGAANIAPARAALVELGLTEGSAERAAWPAPLVDPLSGLDPSCAPLDALADAIVVGLRATAAPPNLPPKLSLVLDGGSGLVAGQRADVRVSVRAGQPDRARLTLSPALRSVLADARVSDFAAPDAEEELSLEAVPSAVLHRLQALSRALANAPDARVAAAKVARWIAAPAEPVGQGAGPRAWLGFHAGHVSWFGLALPFGTPDVAQCRMLAELTEQFGAGVLRVTPGRGVIIPGVRPADAARLAERARAAGFSDEPDAGLSQVSACPGAPACSSAAGDTRSIAHELARVLAGPLSRGAELHVSGCGKSCARSGVADVTIIPAADGFRLGLQLDAAGTETRAALPFAELQRQLASLARA